MKEKELRLALVCYGGVSLAVYMHGVTKEIHKLVRASRAYHAGGSREKRQNATYQELVDASANECDTEPLYLELLQAIGENVELRVIVDTIAGASAGGINAVSLARALAHDLSLDSHRKMWLEQADILALMDEEHLAGKWDKLFMKPIFWGLTDKWLARFAPDLEMRQKLLLFTRSRWFQPPFSGRLMSGMLLDAFSSMGTSAKKTDSLLPREHRLDLIVSVTDFHGYSQNIPLHDPVSIREREHRHVIKFSYTQHASGQVRTGFDEAHIPGLVFAARATSSFPGAFPPVQVGEIDALLNERKLEWPTRGEFLRHSFAPLIAAGADPAQASFIDGSVLNNKPFAEAITSIRGRPAYREVDRRIVYIEPDPKGGRIENAGAAPGFFQTIRGALSDIPRNQPVRDELESLHDFSERVRRYRQIVAATRPHVAARITKLFDVSQGIAPTPHALANLRDQANSTAAVEAGYAYDAYVQLKVSSVLDQITTFLGNVSGAIHHPSERLKLSRSVDTWAKERDVFPVRWSSDAANHTQPSQADAWVQFLRDFDLNFRIRRMRFVIRRLNELYEEGPRSFDIPFEADALDEFKASLYSCLDMLQTQSVSRLQEPRIVKACRDMFKNGLAEPNEIDGLIKLVAPELDLVGMDRIIDQTFAVMAANYLPVPARLELMQAYIGFPFFDVLTLPLNKWQDIDDVDTVLVDRISPDDAKALREGGAAATLMGRDLGYFAAFFSRRARENDYLWGRLHSADRLVDIVVSAASGTLKKERFDKDMLKGRLLSAILKAERPHLPNVQDLISDLEHEVKLRYGIDADQAESSVAGVAEAPPAD